MAKPKTLPAGVALADGFEGVEVLPRIAAGELGHAITDAFARAPYGILLVDRAGTIVRANGEAARCTGHDVAVLEGRAVDELLAPRFHDEPELHWARLIDERVHEAAGSAPDLAIVHADGTEVPVEIGLSTVDAEHETFVLLTLQDISARMRLERQLRDANTELEEFTNVASHDLKSPLRGVRDLVEWIEEDLGPEAPASVGNNLGRIRTRVERMEMLIDELLAYARVGRAAGGYRMVDMGELVQRVLGLVTVPDAFTVEVDVDVPLFLGSSTPLETVVRNLVANAVKHNDRPDGTITIRARAVDDACRIEIVDDGPGVPASAHKRIFRLFQTASLQPAGNAGVGLAVCRRLCDAHDATIAVQSGPGRGATFVVEWPLVARRDAIDA